MASIIPRWYSARSLRHRPGSADDSELRRRACRKQIYSDNAWIGISAYVECKKEALGN